MKDREADFDSIGISNQTNINTKIITSYKPHVFSMNGDLKDIRNLNIQMTHIPLRSELEREHDSK